MQQRHSNNLAADVKKVLLAFLWMAIFFILKACAEPHAYLKGKEITHAYTEKGEFRRINGKWIRIGDCKLDSSRIDTFTWKN